MGIVGLVGTRSVWSEKPPLRDLNSAVWPGWWWCSHWYNMEVGGIFQCSARSSLSFPPSTHEPMAKFQVWEPLTGLSWYRDVVVVWGLVPGVSCTQNYFHFPCTKMLCKKEFIMVSFQKEEDFFPLILFLVSQVALSMLEVASVVRRYIVAHKSFTSFAAPLPFLLHAFSLLW